MSGRVAGRIPLKMARCPSPVAEAELPSKRPRAEAAHKPPAAGTSRLEQLPPELGEHLWARLDACSLANVAETSRSLRDRLAASPAVWRQARAGQYAASLQGRPNPSPEVVLAELGVARRTLRAPADDLCLTFGCAHDSFLPARRWRHSEEWHALFDHNGGGAPRALRCTSLVRLSPSDLGFRLIAADPGRDTVWQVDLPGSSPKRWGGGAPRVGAAWGQFCVAASEHAACQLEHTPSGMRARLDLHDDPACSRGPLWCTLDSPIASPIIDARGTMLVGMRLFGAHHGWLQALVRQDDAFVHAGAPFAEGSAQGCCRCPFTGKVAIWLTAPNDERQLYVAPNVGCDFARVRLPADLPLLSSAEFEPETGELVLWFPMGERQSGRTAKRFRLDADMRAEPVSVPNWYVVAGSSLAQPARQVSLMPSAGREWLHFFGQQEPVAQPLPDPAEGAARCLYVSPTARLAAVVDTVSSPHHPGRNVSQVHWALRTAERSVLLPSFSLPRVGSMICRERGDVALWAGYLLREQVVLGEAKLPTKAQPAPAPRFFEVVRCSDQRPAGLCFSRDGRWLYVLGARRTCRQQTEYLLTAVELPMRLLWRQPLRHRSQNLRLLSASESPDGRRLALGDELGHVVTVVPPSAQAYAGPGQPLRPFAFRPSR